MEIKKTGKLFSFCCMAPLLMKNKNIKEIKYFENIGSEIGLLFQIADDLIDHGGQSSLVGKKTKKDKKQGKATLISLLGHRKAIKYSKSLILRLTKKINKYGPKSNDLVYTLNYILNRTK